MRRRRAPLPQRGRGTNSECMGALNLQPPVAQQTPPLAQSPLVQPPATPPGQERATLQTPEQQRPQPVWERVPTAVDEGRSFFRNTVSGETTRALPRGVRVFFEWF